MNTQKGFAHAVLVLIIVILLLGGLGLVFWKSFTKNNTQSEASEQSQRSDSEDDKSPSDASILKKSYSSIGESGLEFRYPESWTVLPSPKVTTSEDGSKKFVTTMAFSQKPTNDGKLEVTTNHVVVTFTELAGNHSYSFTNPGKQEFESKFKVGDASVGLTAAGKGSSSEPFVSQLLSIDPVSTHGESYLTLQNSYFLLATAQSNSYPAKNMKQRDISKDIEEAKLILKSVKIVKQ